MSDARDVRRETTYSDPDDVRGPFWEEAAGAGRGALIPAAADGVDEDVPLAPDDVSGLARYARWQWRDFWRNRGGWLGVGALLGVWLLVAIAHSLRDNYARSGEVSLPDLSARVTAAVGTIAHVFFAIGGAAAALLGVGGVVSRERERGLQRFLFAKPVRPVRYYLQLLAVNSAGSFAILFGAVLLAAAFLGAAVPVGTILAVAVGAYILTAGLTFLASTLIRFDAPIAAAWLIAGFPVWGAARSGVPGARLALWLFPQGPAAAIVDALSPAGGHPAPHAVFVMGAFIVVLAVGYGLLGVVGGVTVLRRRSIST